MAETMNFHSASQKLIEIHKKLVLVENVAEKYKQLFLCEPGFGSDYCYNMRLMNGCNVAVDIAKMKVMITTNNTWRELNQEQIDLLSELQILCDDYKQSP